MDHKTSERRSLLVTDLDNTLWDWVDAWHRTFTALLDGVAKASGVPQETLEREIKVVHQARGTAEYSWLLNELPSLRRLTPDVDPLVAYDDAVHAMNIERVKATSLYPGVRQALDRLRSEGVLVVAYTESVAYWTEWRIKHTDLDGVIDILYSAPDSDTPDGTRVDDFRTMPPEHYGLRVTRHEHVPCGVTKPSPEVLRSILRDCGRQPGEAVFVGDNLVKDIRMAQTVGVLDAHAKYGEALDTPEYDLLRRVTHWTDKAVEEEREVADKRQVVPTVVLHQFADVLDLFALAPSSA
jgi:FMN phosphatase YigB (HAD superfamily)